MRQRHLEYISKENSLRKIARVAQEDQSPESELDNPGHYCALTKDLFQ